MGGYSGEREISLASGSVVSHHLNKEKFNVYPVIVDTDSWYYKDQQEQIQLWLHNHLTTSAEFLQYSLVASMVADGDLSRSVLL